MSDKYVILVGDGYLTGETLRDRIVKSPSQAKIFKLSMLPDKIEGHNYSYVFDKKRMAYMKGNFKGPVVVDYWKAKKAYDKAVEKRNLANKLHGKKAKMEPIEKLIRSLNPGIKESLQSMIGEDVDEDTVSVLLEALRDLTAEYGKLSDGNLSVVNNLMKTPPTAAKQALHNIMRTAKGDRTKAMEVLVSKSVAKAILGVMAHTLQLGRGITPVFIRKEIIRLIQTAASAYGIASGVTERQLDNLMDFATACIGILTGRIQAIGESRCLRRRSYLGEGTSWPEVKDTIAFAKDMIRDHGRKDPGPKRNVNYRGPDVPQPSREAFSTASKHNLQVGIDKFMAAAKKRGDKIPKTMVKLISALNTWGGKVYNHNIEDAFRDFVRENS
jgi:hypothetical protein